MFEYTAVHWISFFTAAALLNLSPGPDIAYLLTQTVHHGRRAGVAAMFGLWSGTLMHVLLTAAGLAAVLAASSTAFTVLKWAGAGYLVYLGIQALISRSGFAAPSAKAAFGSHFKIYQQGILVSALNPKVAVFFASFLPQFVVAGAGPAAAQLLLHGLLIIFVAAFIEPLVLIFGARLASYLRARSHIAKWVDRALGVLFIGFGLRLALSDFG